MNYIDLKESDLPLDILFNEEVNHIKMEEQLNNQKAKPITFRIEEDFIGKREEGKKETVKFEIEGGGELITSFKRKNEEAFFEFLNDFKGILCLF